MRAAYAAATVAAVSTAMPAVLASGGGAGVNQQAGQMVGTLIGIICLIFRYIGILLAVWAVGMLILAFKNEDADSKSRAMMLLIVSIVLIAIQPLIQAVLTAANAGITITTPT